MCNYTSNTSQKSEPSARKQAEKDSTQLPTQRPCNATTAAGPPRSLEQTTQHVSGRSLSFNLMPYPWTRELTITGTQITFGRRTWRAKWSHAASCRLSSVCPWAPGWAGTDPLHNKGPRDLWHSQLMDIQRHSSSQGLSWKPPDSPTHTVRDIKAHGLLCSGSLPRGTSWSCYFAFASQLNFKDLDAWDTYGKPGAETGMRSCLTVKCGACWESSNASLGHWSCCYQQASVQAQVVKCDWMAKQESFFNSYRV